MTRKITTKRARQIRIAIYVGRNSAIRHWPTLWVMDYADRNNFTKLQRKVAIDVYHAKR